MSDGTVVAIVIVVVLIIPGAIALLAEWYVGPPK